MYSLSSALFSGMGTFPSRQLDGKEGAEIEHSGSDCQPIIEQDESKRRGSSRRHDSAETLDCPTCQGTGRIPRGTTHTLTYTCVYCCTGEDFPIGTFPNLMRGETSENEIII